MLGPVEDVSNEAVFINEVARIHNVPATLRRIEYLAEFCMHRQQQTHNKTKVHLISQPNSSVNFCPY